MGRNTPVLIETVRLRSGRAPLWHLHMRRLAGSCDALGIPFPRTLEVPAGGRDRVHRLAVGVGGAEAGEREVGSARPLRLVSSPIVHEPYPHKTTARGQFERALAHAGAMGADDAILCTASGSIAEACIWCLFWWEGEELVAPAVDLGILPGVSRLRIAELVGRIGERRVGRRGLAGVSLFAANAVRGIVPVAELDGVPVPPDERTERLAEGFWP